MIVPTKFTAIGPAWMIHKRATECRRKLQTEQHAEAIHLTMEAIWKAMEQGKMEVTDVFINHKAKELVAEILVEQGYVVKELNPGNTFLISWRSATTKPS